MTPRFPRTTYARTTDRLPHEGPAAFGPYVDRDARVADAVALIVAAAAFGVVIWMDYINVF